MNRISLAAAIDGMRFRCRLRDLDFFDPATTVERVGRIAAAIERLGSGRFVMGMGPYCSEVIRVGAHAIRLGRHAGPLEQPHEEVVDYSINDASLHGPREVSRLHCTLDPAGCADDELNLIDEASSTGTWIHPVLEQVLPHTPHRLSNGTMFSLGPSGTNTFLFIVV